MIAAAPAGVRQSLRDRAETARRRSRTTPGHLQMLVLLIGGTSAALFLVGSATLVAAQRSVAGMRHETVPAIVGAQRIHATLADADRAEANAFLSGAIEAAGPHHQYEADIAAAMRELEQAAEQAGGNQAVGRQIQTISVMVTQYTTLVDIARADNQQGYPVGAAYLRQASQLMHRPGDGILASVDQLGDLDAQDLGAENTTLVITVGLLVLYAGAAITLLAVLVHCQRFVRERFRRRRNRRLLMATGVLLLLSVTVASEAVFTAQTLVMAEGQDYNRLLNLWHIRSLVYDANGNESLSLIARGNGDAFDRTFQSNTARLADRPMTDDLVNQAARGDVRFQGLLADELNASSGDEHDAALDVLRAYRRFMGVDATVRARSQQGDHDSAARLALGAAAGQLGAAFSSLDTALGRTIDAVQAQFDRSVAFAEYSLLGHVALQLLTIVIVLLAYRGLKPRIDEYRS
ncbi:MAG TPA: hypothetical protein VOB72_27560 [Candidatus Dormibacteraeota bacterium]|nr:hypothetical protein [Candidatus Dormibacteraeota bacterium]